MLQNSKWTHTMCVIAMGILGYPGAITVSFADNASPDAIAKPLPTKDRASGNDLQLEEIVVTAQKRVENLQNVPIAVQVISGQVIARRRPPSPGR